MTPHLDPLELRKTFGLYPTGVALTAGHLDGTPIGMLTNSFTTISLDPPLISLSFAHTSTTWPQLQQLDHIGISILSAHNLETATLLKRPTAQRFDGVEVITHNTGAVVLPDAAAQIFVEKQQEIEAGDHTLTLWKVTDHIHNAHHNPLVFHKGRINTL
ncbi:flavin reductase [Corynebacterium sp. sy017]|uniref:flavin reductase family protein n=1 Tax=unclassified Corynebacterium TaxID=2624378 RepID=UPI0011859511|nr:MULTISPECIES: flavin reductase family protein [unclassified Corynebacterium]MBP3089125.1 flavin reductase [Corynebacterium sp. sy017]TSD91439.1 flavin reductase [Corynebacterium sp. SY003]